MQRLKRSQPASALFIPHGGGPLPLLDDPGHRELTRFLVTIGDQLGKPDAIVVISAHWEQPLPCLTSGTQPHLIYDYYGFPPESYQVTYPAQGRPELAHSLWQCLQENQVDAALAPDRGFDHGLFVPLKLMYPEADIPCIQLSLVNTLDPATHIRIGKVLRALRQENVLVLGSGFSFHNLQALLSDSPNSPDPRNEAFEHWLVETCTHEGISEEVRRDRLINWAQAPHANYCHPRAEHLLPLHVCYGLAGTAARLVFDGRIMGKKASAFLW